MALLLAATAACTSPAPSSTAPSVPTGVASSSVEPSRPLSPVTRLSARVELSATTIAAGATVTGHVVVENRTSHAIRVFGCGSPFQVALVNDRVKPRIVWLQCLTRLTIRRGTSAWPINVSATYSFCARTGPVRCEHDHVPSLPVGRYRAVLFQSPRHLVPDPPPVDVLVAPA